MGSEPDVPKSKPDTLRGAVASCRRNDRPAVTAPNYRPGFSGGVRTSTSNESTGTRWR